MPRGGARPGAGRKPGSANKKTREIAERAIEEGLTPLEVMLDNMCFFREQAIEIAEKITAATERTASTEELATHLKDLLHFRDISQRAAKDAAPYVHPRLSSIEQQSFREPEVPKPSIAQADRDHMARANHDYFANRAPPDIREAWDDLCARTRAESRNGGSIS